MESCVNMATERIQSVSLGKTSSSDFQPLVIIQFSTSSKQAAIEWLVAKLQATRASGGAELEVSTVVMHHNQVTKKSRKSSKIICCELSLRPIKENK